MTTDVLTAAGVGTAMVSDRDRVDFTALRAARRQRVLDRMAELDVDALILGREGNVRYASGARRLWTASSRPFGPTCVLVRDTGRVHLMTFAGSSDDAPADADPDDVYCTSFNPARLLERVGAIAELAGARRVGVDGFSPLMQKVLPSVMPHAEFVGFEPQLRALRRRKLPDEVAALRIALAVGESAVAAALTRLAPGVSEKELQATFLERICALGTSQFAQQGTFTVVGPDGGLRWITSERRCQAGDLVAVAAGALWAGYEGSVARTWWCGEMPPPTDAHRALYRRWRAATDAVIARCRPGATGADLAAAHVGSGEPLPAMPIVYAVGLGHEGPLAGMAAGRDADASQVVEAGMVLAVRSFVPSPLGGFLGEEVVHVGAERTERLTTLGHGPLA